MSRSKRIAKKSPRVKSLGFSVRGSRGRYSAFVAGKGYMGRKDIVDRLYFSDCRCFAEFMNATLYQGEEVFLPENFLCEFTSEENVTISCFDFVYSGPYGEKK